MPSPRLLRVRLKYSTFIKKMPSNATPPHHVQGFDPLIRGNRYQILVGDRQRC
jgi:hypothetical protein